MPCDQKTTLIERRIIMNYLILLTPDLTVSPLVDAMAGGFERVLCPKLSRLERHSRSVLEGKIHDLNEKILRDHQKQWFQTLSINGDDLVRPKYKSELASIIGQMDEKRWVVCDSQLVHFLPLWLSSASKTKTVFHYSEPLECALTLQQKWRFPIAFGLALWEQSVLAAGRNLAAHEYTLISSKRLRSANSKYLKTLVKEFGELDSEVLTKSSSEGVSDLDFELSSAIKTCFDLLEKRKLTDLADRSLSAQSKDILDYYGQIRAGHEQLKVERDQLIVDLAQATAKIDSDSDDQNADEKKVTVVDEALSRVKVHLEGMDTLEFYADPESPILDMLRTNLLSTDQDQLMFLNYGEDDNDTLYFMSSDLLAIEIEPAVNH